MKTKIKSKKIKETLVNIHNLEKQLVNAIVAVQSLTSTLCNKIEWNSDELINNTWFENEELESPLKITPDVEKARRRMLLDKLEEIGWIRDEVSDIFDPLDACARELGYGNWWELQKKLGKKKEAA